MVWMQAADDKNCIFLTEGYAPLKDLRKVYPQRPSYKWAADREPKDPEEAIAWIVTAYTQELIPFSMPGLPSYTPVETWLIGPPYNVECELAEWFKGELPETNYRIFIHRQPQYHEGREIYANHFGNAHHRLHTRHRTGKHTPLLRLSEPLLEDVVKAYREGHEAVEARIARTNHPYSFSNGLIS